MGVKFCQIWTQWHNNECNRKVLVQKNLSLLLGGSRSFQEYEHNEIYKHILINTRNHAFIHENIGCDHSVYAHSQWACVTMWNLFLLAERIHRVITAHVLWKIWIIDIDIIILPISHTAFFPLLQVNHQKIGEEDCCCGSVTGEAMVKCSSRGRCVGRVWYHLQCVHLNRVPKGKWICDAVTERERGVDRKLEYTKAILWMGLNDRVRHSAVRANDGDGMISHWRCDMVEFFTRSHYKYFIHGHRLLSYVSGAGSPQLAHTLRWNRTVNTSGGPNRNLEMDLHMEFLNKSYKESSRTSRGQLTDATVGRHSRMLAVAEHVSKLFDSRRVVRRRHGKVEREGQVQEMVGLIVEGQLTEAVPGHGITTAWQTSVFLGGQPQ